MKVNNLHKARRKKDDEFYTLYEDIEKELIYFKDDFKDKTIYCNCDDVKISNFYKYFKDNFEKLELKQLIATNYQENNIIYETILNKDLKEKKIKLKGNGDFRNKENIDILKKSDIIITNPPFSLFREYLDQLIEYNKKFLIVASKNALTYDKTFNYIKNNQISLSYNKSKGSMYFITPQNNELKSVGSIWLTNIKDIDIPFLKLEKNYFNEKNLYQHCENLDCKGININKTKDIPFNYDGVMAVPITFLLKYNKKQFKILGLDKDLTNNKNRCIIDGKKKYARVMIKNKLS
jgi:hypothetical protein